MLEKDKLHTEEVKSLQIENENSVTKLEEDYKKHLAEIVQEFEDSKKTADGLKMMYEEKLTQQEDEHEDEIAQVNTTFECQKKELHISLAAL